MSVHLTYPKGKGRVPVKNASSIGEAAADELDDDQTLQNDDKFMQLVTKHYNDPHALEMDDIYDMPRYPVAKHQQEQNIIEQMQKLKVGCNEDKGLFDFQHITVCGEETSGVPMDHLHMASLFLIKALSIREKYMKAALQSFPVATSHFLSHVKQSDESSPFNRCTTGKHSAVPTGDCPVGPSESESPFHVEKLPENSGYQIGAVDGVYSVLGSDYQQKVWFGFDRAEFIADFEALFALTSDECLKSFCKRRLMYLSSKYELHILLNELREASCQKEVEHRDFYNVRKV